MPLTSAITSWTWRTQSEHRPTAPTRAAYRSILRHSNAPCVQSASLERTTSAHISEHTPMSDLSFARSAVKLLHVSTTGNGTKAYIPARRSLFARATSKAVSTGAAAEGSPVLMRWAATSAQKPAASASNPYWTKKQLSGRKPGSKSSSMPKSPLAL